MKKFLSAAGVLWLAIVSVLAPPSNRFVLTWVYDTTGEEPDTVFKIYYSKDASLPKTNWTVLATVPMATLSITVTGSLGKNFYTVTASNSLAESDWGAVIGATVPKPVGEMSIGRAQ